MSKYNHYAKDLEAAFLAARQEYSDAWAALEAAEKKKTCADGAAAKARAEADFIDATENFKRIQEQSIDILNRKRSELRAALEKELREASAANPDSVDEKAVKLLESGIMTVDDFYKFGEKFDGNPTMLRLVAKYAKEAADDLDSTQSKERGALNYLCLECSQSLGKTMREWDNLSKVVDYCSGQAHGKRERPSYVLSMASHWEELAGDAVASF